MGGGFPLDLTGFKIRQTHGAELGYIIEPTAANELPDISAFAVSVPATLGVRQVRLRVIEKSSGMPVPGTDREIIVVGEPNPLVLWGGALLPLMFGAGLLGHRRLRPNSTNSRTGKSPIRCR